MQETYGGKNAKNGIRTCFVLSPTVPLTLFPAHPALNSRSTFFIPYLPAGFIECCGHSLPCLSVHRGDILL